MQREVFGKLETGEPVERVRIEGGGLTAQVISWGAVLQDLRIEGHGPPLVLGLNRLEDYVAHSPYFGATAGRVANRIGQGRFTLDGREYQLTLGPGQKHQLHGGPDGLGTRNWTITEVAADRVELAATLPDGHMGYPGELKVGLTVGLPGSGALDLRYRAESDAPTLCNLAHHSYFNLTGGPDLAGHRLSLSAEALTEVDGELIPTGRILPVEGTDHDFRRGVDLGAWPEGRLLDHNFCLAGGRQPLRTVGRLESAAVAMDIQTTEPGLQIYDGAKLDVPVPGLDGARYGPRAGMAIEPQIWPDAINHPGFPSPVLRPGEVYEQHSRFVFSLT